MSTVDPAHKRTIDWRWPKWIVLSVLASVVFGLLFAFLNGGSMLLCLTYLPGETTAPPKGFRPIYDLAHSHLALCVQKEGPLSLIFILLGALAPFTWLASLQSAAIYLPRFICMGAVAGLFAELIRIGRERTN
jgi:hypothetical protein